MKKFISWNVNGLRACMGKGFDDIFKLILFSIHQSESAA